MIDFKFTQQIDLPISATYSGPVPFNPERLAVILNSRQSKTPCGQDQWIINTIKAVKQTIADDYTILSSIGMNTWELVTWACGKYGARQIVVCPLASDDEIPAKAESVISDFGLNPSKTGWLFYRASANARSPKANWPPRDKLAMSLAQFALPVSLRPNGNLERLLSQNANLTIIESFQTEYQPECNHQQKISPIENVNYALLDKPWDYITHWTHVCHGPWPKQSSRGFYENLSNSKLYPNSALDTLINIIKEKTIRGSSENIRDGLPVVAFSSLQPKEMLPLLSWRKRYVRYNFEPYGIAIKRSVAVELGARPVIYGQPSLYKRLSDNDKPFFQSEGVKGGNWRPESEWRYIGDFDLRSITQFDLKIVVREPEEMAAVRAIAGCETLSFT